MSSIVASRRWKGLVWLSLLMGTKKISVSKIGANANVDLRGFDVIREVLFRYIAAPSHLRFNMPRSVAGLTFGTRRLFYSQPLVTPLGALATQCATCCQCPFSLTQVSPNTLSAVSTLPP